MELPHQEARRRAFAHLSPRLTLRTLGAGLIVLPHSLLPRHTHPTPAQLFLVFALFLHLRERLFLVFVLPHINYITPNPRGAAQAIAPPEEMKREEVKLSLNDLSPLQSWRPRKVAAQTPLTDPPSTCNVGRFRAPENPVLTQRPFALLLFDCSF